MLHILSLNEGDSLDAFARRIEQTEGELVIVLSPSDGEALLRGGVGQEEFLRVCNEQSGRIRIATKNTGPVSLLRAKGLRVLDRMADLKSLLQHHPNAGDAMHVFSPHLWRQQLRSQLQSIGILSLPKLRIWTLIIISAVLFFFALFRLLPSAEIRVWPREDGVSQTVNIFLVLSGATIADVPPRVRTMELMPVTVEVNKTLTFDQISKEFIGTSAAVPMTIVNEANEQYSLRAGTRVSNQAGMVFRLLDHAIVDAGEEMTVRSEADDLDLYGEIIGERGNVPAGLRWEFPGLAPAERKLVYAENRVDAKGGTTQFRTVLHDKDLALAQRRLEQELLTTAKQLVEEDRVLFNTEHADRRMELLYYDELTKAEYKDIVLPTQFLGEAVTSIPVEGKIIYTAFGYDIQYVLEVLSDEVRSHVGEGKRVLDETLTLDRLVAHVIAYDDNLSWIKITVDLSGTEQYILDPLTPSGARFAKQVREGVVGKETAEAVRVVRNLPEVENAEISVWPPWSQTLPSIPAHISIVPVMKEPAV